MNPPIEQEVVTDVTTAVNSVSVISHIKENRLEYIGLLVLAHLLGLSSYIGDNLSGVCI